jgi:transposase InsO family protein
MCAVFCISRSSYYKWLKRKVHLSNHVLISDLILKTFDKCKRHYGSPRVCEELKDMGIIVSKSTVARIMKSLGIQARPRRKFVHTTDSKHSFKVFENVLDRMFESKRVNEKWLSDITYIPTQSGWAYLTIVIDLADRMIVGWHLSKDLTAQNTSIKALEIALKRRVRTGKLLFHSDRGVQYCCFEFRDQLKKAGSITHSMSRKGNCWDNAPAESFFKTLKVEWTNRFKYNDIEEARKSIFNYIEMWYNTKRKHSSNKMLSPLQKHNLLTRTAA